MLSRHPRQARVKNQNTFHATEPNLKRRSKFAKRQVRVKWRRVDEEIGVFFGREHSKSMAHIYHSPETDLTNAIGEVVLRAARKVCDDTDFFRLYFNRWERL
jgi:hypothetical protein